MDHRTLALCLFLSLPVALPATAQETAPAPSSPPAAAEDDGFSLMEEGAKLLFRGLMNEMEPALDEMGRAVGELEPALNDLMAMIDDIRNYQAPEMLPNGDIIIRRKAPLPGPSPLPAPDAPLAGPDGQIDL